MPVVILFAALMALLLFMLLMLPFSIVHRYRMGTSRRLARGWMATLNFFGVATSAILFLVIAAVTSLWVPRAFTYSVLGMMAGSLLGLAGLMLSRWEVTPRTLHYTPNRWLVLAITLVVSARLAYGFWRGWHAWGETQDDVTWLAAAGAAGSLGAGAVVLGYYLMYWAGLRRKLQRLEKLRS